MKNEIDCHLMGTVKREKQKKVFVQVKKAKKKTAGTDDIKF